MSNESAANKNPIDFESWVPLLEAAIEFAERYDEPYRAPIVQAILTSRAAPSSRGGTSKEKKPSEVHSEISVTPISHGGLAAVAKQLEVDPRALSRIIDISEDNGDPPVRILARIDGQSKSERANRYAAVYCFIKEKALGQLDTDIEEIRGLVKQQGCYDMLLPAKLPK